MHSYTRHSVITITCYQLNVLFALMKHFYMPALLFWQLKRCSWLGGSDSLGQNTIALMLQRSYFPKLARTHTTTCFEINTRRERGNFSVHFKICLYLYEEPDSSQVAWWIYNNCTATILNTTGCKRRVLYDVSVQFPQMWFDFLCICLHKYK